MPPRRRWRDYKTTAGRSLVEQFIDSLSDVERPRCWQVWPMFAIVG
ncbi:MAG TPA: hypothetical protein VGF70_09180 [Solirubrobacteraceae bacterium]